MAGCGLEKGKDERRVKRACAYVRVSTVRQAEHETSLDDQIASIRHWCAARAILLDEIFVEAGASGTDENRPRFVAMLDRATDADRPWDMILVHSLSRFARDLMTQLLSQRRLKRAGVELVSITQEFSDDPAGNMMRNIVAIFDQHQSEETAKHTRRTMRANAEAGFWNGAVTPLGYEARTVERRGTKDKKKLFVNEDEAAIVRRIFRLALAGDGTGPMGARAIAQWLNARGDHLRGKSFSNSNVAGILARDHYTGRYFTMRRDARTGQRRPSEQWVAVACPAIIAQADFDAVQALRAVRNPRTTPPRVTAGPTLLVGLARCGHAECRRALTIRTGKSGAYSYYACARRVNAGAASCTTKQIRREKLDALVIDALERQLLQPDQLRQQLSDRLDRSTEADTQRRHELALYRAEHEATDAAIRRLVQLVEEGLMSPRDAAFAERMAHNRNRLQELAARIAMIERPLASEAGRMTPAMIDEAAGFLSGALRADDPERRRRTVRALVGEVVVEDTRIRITGATAALEHAVVNGPGWLNTPVPSFDRIWCPRVDSNHRPAV